MTSYDVVASIKTHLYGDGWGEADVTSRCRFAGGTGEPSGDGSGEADG